MTTGAVRNILSCRTSDWEEGLGGGLGGEKGAAKRRAIRRIIASLDRGQWVRPCILPFLKDA